MQTGVTGCSGSSSLTSQQRAQQQARVNSSNLVGRVLVCQQQQAPAMRGAASWPCAWLAPLQQWTGFHAVHLQQQRQQPPAAEERSAAAEVAVLCVLQHSRHCALCLPVPWCFSHMMEPGGCVWQRPTRTLLCMQCLGVT